MREDSLLYWGAPTTHCLRYLERPALLPRACLVNTGDELVLDVVIGTETLVRRVKVTVI